MQRKLLFAAVLGVFATYLPASAQNNAGKLAYEIPQLYGPSGLTLPSSFHAAHFENSFQESFTPLNSAVASQLTLLPIASPASGFVYAFDQSLGVYKRTSESFGPILTERGETVGRHRLYFAVGYQYFGFSTLDGQKLNNLPVIFQHAKQTGANYEQDYIQTNNSIDLKINQFTMLGTFGLTDRVDVSVAVPILNVHLGVSSDANIRRIAPPSPVFGQAHYFDPGDPNGSTRKIFSAGGNASGIGDVTFRLKGTVWRGERSAVALAADVRTPTGDAYNFLGTDAVGLRPFIIGSFRRSIFAPHVNFGYQWNGNSILAGDVGTGRKARLPSELLYAFGTDVGVVRRVTLNFDVLGQHVYNGRRAVRTTYTDANGTQFPTIGLGRDSFDILDGSAGGKINLGRKMLLTANLIFKMNDAGLRARVVPLVGLSYTF